MVPKTDFKFLINAALRSTTVQSMFLLGCKVLLNLSENIALLKVFSGTSN